jgi:hypothetical protein
VRDTSRARAVLGERGGGLADERREHLGACIGAEGVAAGQEQATTSHADAAIRLHGRVEVADRPDLAGWLHAADDVAIDRCRRWGRADAGRHGNDADAAFEFSQRVVGDGGRGEHSERTEDDGRDELHDGLPVWWCRVRALNAAQTRETRLRFLVSFMS